MKQNIKNCLECNTSLSGRADKKYCDDQCRSAYHYRMYGAESNTIRRINNQLRRNRKVLEEIARPAQRLRISVSRLEDAGFNFRYFTHTSINQRGEEFKVCYDYGFRSMDDGQCQVVHWK